MRIRKNNGTQYIESQGSKFLHPSSLIQPWK